MYSKDYVEKECEPTSIPISPSINFINTPNNYFLIFISLTKSKTTAMQKSRENDIKLI